MPGSSDVEYFARLVDALEPWLGQVVIIGGWAAVQLVEMGWKSRHQLQQLLDPVAGDREDSNSGTTLTMGAEIHASC